LMITGKPEPPPIITILGFIFSTFPKTNLILTQKKG